MIAKALRNSTSTSLRELDLSSTSIDDKAAGSLAALLATPGCKLERLLLSNTNITDAGAQLLCNALQVSGRGGRNGEQGTVRILQPGWIAGGALLVGVPVFITSLAACHAPRLTTSWTLMHHKQFRC